MRREELFIGSIPALLLGEAASGVYLYLHGQNGRKEEAESFAALACPKGWQVLSIDLPEHGAQIGNRIPLVPWTVLPQLETVLNFARKRWAHIALYGVSLGAWFGLMAFQKERLERTLLVSPVVDMEALILRMMSWAGVTEEQLRRESTVPTDFGQTLSWEYLCYVREHTIRHWNIPTEILYAGKDDLVARETVLRFAQTHNSAVTIYEDGEHWFHTPEQLDFLNGWLQERIGISF